MRDITNQFLQLVLLLFFTLLVVTPLSSMASHSHSDYKVSFFIDTLKNTRISEIGAKDFDQNFKKVRSNRLNFGFFEGQLWLKIVIPETATTQVLELNSAAITTVNFYSSFEDKGLTNQNHKILSNDINFRTLLIELPTDSTNFINISAAGHLFLKYFIYEKNDYFSHSGIDYLSIGLFLGFIFTFSIYAFIIRKIAHPKHNSYFLFLILFVGLYFSALSGVLGQYFIASKYTQLALHCFSSIIILIVLGFTRDFLRTSTKHKTVDLFIKSFFFIALLNLLLFPFYDSVVVYKLGRYLEICVPAVILYASVNSLMQGRKEVRYLVMGWSFYFASFIFSSFMQIGVLPVSFLTLYSMHFGVTAVIIFLAWALMDEFNAKYKQSADVLKDDHLKSNFYIQHLKSEIALKEQSVLRHADLLVQKDKEIEFAQCKVRQQGGLDRITGLISHNSFMLQFQHYFDDAKRYQYPVITMLIVLDDFKQITARYGQLIADTLLSKTANVITQESRNTDLVGRYQNDEIIFVMTHASIEQALVKSEDLISKINKIKSPQYPELKLTTSIGMSVMEEAATIGDSRLFLNEVENALKQSRQDGGDCLSVYSYADHAINPE